MPLFIISGSLCVGGEYDWWAAVFLHQCYSSIWLFIDLYFWSCKRFRESWEVSGNNYSKWARRSALAGIHLNIHNCLWQSTTPNLKFNEWSVFSVWLSCQVTGPRCTSISFAAKTVTSVKNKYLNSKSLNSIPDLYVKEIVTDARRSFDFCH